MEICTDSLGSKWRAEIGGNGNLVISCNFPLKQTEDVEPSWKIKAAF